jgi:hypothetical protein
MRLTLIVELESWNGERFTLLGPDKGDRGVYLDQSPEGLFEDEPTEAIYNSHAFQKGADFGGIVIDKKDITFGAHVKDTKDATWLENYSAWKRALHFKKDSKLWVETDEFRRYVNVRLLRSNGMVPEINPDRTQYARVAMSLVAGDPRWHENDLTNKWTTTVDNSAPANKDKIEWGEVWVQNLTDTDIWLKWVCQAYPGVRYIIPDYSWGDDRFEHAEEDAERLVVMPPLLAGEHFRIDTDEEELQVESNLDTQMYIRMKGVSFLYPVPAGTKRTKVRVGAVGAPIGVGVQVRCPRVYTSPLVIPG